MVGELDDQSIANANANQRTRQRAVIRPGLEAVTGVGLDGCHAGVECDFDDPRIGIQIVSVNGGISVTGTRGRASLETTNGGIKVQNVQGNMTLETVNVGIDVINAHERDPSAYVAGIADAVEAVVSGRMDPSRLYTHYYPLERLGEALDATRDRPEGFVKALVTP